jgi:LmbE family N-acetylglucosaminyl deacetylase
LIPLSLGAPAAGPTRVLCLGAHCDDIEIGCGGTLLRWLEERPELEVRWVVFSSDARRAGEARASVRRFLGAEPDKCLTLHAFRDGFLPYQGAEVKDAFEQLKGEFAPDVVFTHYRHDLHQDHRLVSELTWNTFRGPLVLEYEIPKWDGDLGSPNAFVPLSERQLQRKIEVLMDEYGTQRTRSWFAPDTFRALARLRGVEAAVAEGYAEAFYARKVVVELAISGSRT